MHSFLPVTQAVRSRQSITARTSGFGHYTASESCSVADNHCGENGQCGIDIAGRGSRIENNHLVGNLTAIDAASPQGKNLIIRNTSALSRGTPFVFSTNNYFGTIVSNTAMGFGGFATNNSWANFVY